MIASGGENIATPEGERVLYEHPAVLEAAVVGLQHLPVDEAGTRVLVGGGLGGHADAAARGGLGEPVVDTVALAATRRRVGLRCALIAAAAGLSALMLLPVGVVLVLRQPPGAEAVGYAVAAGVPSSAVPYLADLFTLRRPSGCSSPRTR